MMPDIDPMMPDIDLREERKKKRARAGICVIAGPMTVLMLIQPGWKWVPVVGVIAITAICAIAVSGELPGGHRGGSGLSGHGRDDDGGPAGAAHRWHMLVMVSRLMPRPAGRRWLAEAESLLSEITPVRRSAAIRSYLLSAPRLVVMMWAREAQRRARHGPN